MKIVVAKTAGFCFGVNRAVDTVYQNIEHQDSDIYTLGPIIHNNQVVNELRSKGVQAVQNIDEIQSSRPRLIIRTHGVSKNVYNDIQEKKIQCVDATCPYVKKIHRIVEQYHENGYLIIIVGNPDHPEVKGINGWCNNTAVILDDVKDIEQVKDRLLHSEKICVVAQTTINRDKWDKITEILKNNCKEVEIFDTICNATNLRQAEAAKIAKEVDIMFVIGGKHSSNTQKLVEICKMYCDNTYHIETFEDLPQSIVYFNKKIGVTAGASTPAWIIKEVIEKMSENEKMKTTNEEVSFEEAFEQSLVTLNTGEIVKGTVIGVTDNEVYVDLGYKSDGVISADELTDDPSEKVSDIVKVGDELEVFIVRVNDGDGNVQLSKKKVDFIKGWEEIEQAYKDKTVLKGKVIQIVNGGVIALAKGIRVFIPASQLSDKYVADLNEFLKETVSFKVIEVNNRKKRVVGSVRVVVEEENRKKAEEFWGNIEVGKKFTGTVKQLTNFGAFVDLGPVDGLIHISELSWVKIKHPSQIVKEGDIVEVYVLEFDKENNRISLGFKKAEDNPWEIVKSKYNVGDVIKCKVVRLVPFGAFVELVPGADGLIHISQISNKRIGKPEDVLKVGEEVEAKITEMDLENQKVSLSIRELLPPEPPKGTEKSKEEKDEQDDLPTEYTEDVKVTIGDAVSEKLDEVVGTAEEANEENIEKTEEK